jgi:teichuronic acid exporter
LLEPSDFGLIAMLMVVIGIAQVFTDVGLAGALIQRRKVLPIHYSYVFYFNIIIAMLLTCTTFPKTNKI